MFPDKGYNGGHGGNGGEGGNGGRAGDADHGGISPNGAARNGRPGLGVFGVFMEEIMDKERRVEKMELCNKEKSNKVKLILGNILMTF